MIRSIGSFLLFFWMKRSLRPGLAVFLLKVAALWLRFYRYLYHPTMEKSIGAALFPRENPVTGPREWAEPVYKIARWTQMPRGGHFPAAEEPGLLAA